VSSTAEGGDKVVLDVHHAIAKVKMVFDTQALVSECRAQLERKLLRIDPTANTAVHSIDSLEPVRSSPLSLSLSLSLARLQDCAFRLPATPTLPALWMRNDARLNDAAHQIEQR
jgi:hypothetical protein